MKHSPGHLIAATLLAAVGAAAVAQTPAAPQGNGPQMEERQGFDRAQMQQRRQARMAQRMTRLKEALQIAPGQEGAWTAWVAAMQPPANWKRPDRAEFERLTTPERIDRMRALRTERNAMMDRRAEGTKSFYAGLNETQKRVFDLATAHAMGHRGGDRDGNGGQRRHNWN